MKERQISFSGPMIRALLDGTKTQTRRIVKGTAETWLECAGFLPDFVALPQNNLCRYGYMGDTLWVRENWRAPLAYELTKPSHIPAGTPVLYEADESGDLPGFNAGKLRPSMFMPHWASRIKLDNNGVRIERLQDISEADAKAEGLLRAGDGFRGAEGLPSFANPVAAYQSLWESINGPESWADNPWVWVIEFQRLEQPS